jgi:hypothetical protein
VARAGSVSVVVATWAKTDAANPSCSACEPPGLSLPTRSAARSACSTAWS